MLVENALAETQEWKLVQAIALALALLAFVV
jgi:hypothetical protein